MFYIFKFMYFTILLIKKNTQIHYRTEITQIGFRTLTLNVCNIVKFMNLQKVLKYTFEVKLLK